MPHTHTRHDGSVGAIIQFTDATFSILLVITVEGIINRERERRDFSSPHGMDTLSVTLHPLVLPDDAERGEARPCVRATASLSTSPPRNQGLVHTPSQRGTFHENIIANAMIPSANILEIENRLQCKAASYLSECERGFVVTRVPPSVGKAAAFATGYFVLDPSEDGSRQYHVVLTEEGRYMASLTVPATVVRLLGSAAVTTIMNTSVRGYDITSAAAETNQVPTYFPLDARLKENMVAVQRGMQSRLERLAGLVTVMRLQLLGAMQKEVGSDPRTERADAVRRLVFHRPSPLRTSQSLRGVLHRMLRGAVSSVYDGAISGPMTAYGIGSDEKRFTCVASAVWFRGNPLYASSPDTGCGSSCQHLFEQHLVPAALAVLADDYHAYPTLRAFRARTSSSRNLISMKCIAMGGLRAHRGSGSCAARGFVGRTMLADEAKFQAGASLAVAMTSRTGWTITLLLTVSPMPYLGTPLRHVIGQTRELLSGTLETADMYHLLYKESIVRRLFPMDQLPRGLGPSAVATTSHGLHLPWMEQVQHVRLMCRPLGRCGLDTTVRDREWCLFSWSARCSASREGVTFVEAHRGDGGGLFHCFSGPQLQEVNFLTLGDDDDDPRSYALGCDWLEARGPDRLRTRVDGILRVATQRIVMSSSRQTHQCRLRRGMRGGPVGDGLFTLIERSDRVVAVHAVASRRGDPSRSGGESYLVYGVIDLNRKKGNGEAYSVPLVKAFTSWLISKAL